MSNARTRRPVFSDFPRLKRLIFRVPFSSSVLAIVLSGWLASTPTYAQVELTGISKIVAGDEHTCALSTTGGVKCWGQNYYAQLGDNTKTNRQMAANVTGLASGVVSIAAGGTASCAITFIGDVKCWGNMYPVGDPIFFNGPLTPIDVPGLAIGVASIAVGDFHKCALSIAGGVKCWGVNSSGQLGDNSTTQRTSPVDVFGLSSGVQALTAGQSHTCALTTAGGVKCWGSNSHGRLGDGSTTMRLIPVDVGLASTVSAIVAGKSHTCALTTSGGVKCWGSNFQGELGDNSTSMRLTPVDVVGLTTGVAAIAAGYQQTCALTTNGVMKCWGNTGRGSFTLDPPRLIPIDVAIGSRASAIAVGGSINFGAGDTHGCAVIVTGAVKCVGSNSFGQLGDNSISFRSFPVSVVTQLVDTAVLSAAISPLPPVVSGRSTTLTALVKMRSPLGTVTVSDNGVPISGCSQRPLALLPSASDSAIATCILNAHSVGTKQYDVTYSYPANHVSGRVSEQVNVSVTTTVQGPADYTDMWWAGPVENGWGVSITQHGPIQFNVIYAYDDAGKPVWYVMPGGSWNAAQTAFTGALYLPTSSPFNAYDKTQFRVGNAVGSATLTYISNGLATLDFNINGISGSKNLQRQIYAADDGQPKLQVNDLWWAGSQEDGWGMNIAQQGRMLFPVWYTYDASGKATWFPVPGGTWSGTVFTGDIYSTTSSPWLGAQYNANSFQVTKVGVMTITFIDQNNATMTYSVNGISQTKIIVRQPY